MGLTVSFEVLNQFGTPLMYSETLANRPAFGIAGRIFFRTDSPFGIYRDTGSAWDQISGASTFSGSLATGQVAFGSATNTISGTNNLFWDNSNIRLGIGTNAPTEKLSIIGNQSLQGYLYIDDPSVYAIRLINNKRIAGHGGGGGSEITLNLAAIIAGYNSLDIRTQLAGNITFQTNGANTRMQVFGATGNVAIQNGGTFVDAGQRLQVYGSTLLKGSGTTSATTGLSVQNSASGPLLQVRDDSVIIIGGASTGMYCSVDSGQTITQGAGGIYLGYFATGDLGYVNIPSVTLGRPNNRLLNATSSVQIMASIVGNYSPTSGTGTFIALDINNIINQTGGSNGITRGIYVNPTLTVAADWRSINWTNNSGFGLYGSGSAPNYLNGNLLIKTATDTGYSAQITGSADLMLNVWGATSPSIRLTNAASAPTLSFAIGLATATNNFIQGSVSGDVCITTAATGNPMLFGMWQTTNATEVMRISTALNLQIGSITDTGQKFQLTGSIRVNGQTSGTASGSSGQHLIINCDGTNYKIALLNA